MCNKEDSYPQKEWTPSRKQYEFITLTLILFSCFLIVIIPFYVIVGEPKYALDLDNGVHITLLIISILLVLIYVLKFFIEYKFEPEAFSLFVIYFIITIILITIQSIIMMIVNFADIDTYSNPSKTGFIIVFVFGILQLIGMISIYCLECNKFTFFVSNDVLLPTV